MTAANAAWLASFVGAGAALWVAAPGGWRGAAAAAWLAAEIIFFAAEVCRRRGAPTPTACAS